MTVVKRFPAHPMPPVGPWEGRKQNPCNKCPAEAAFMGDLTAIGWDVRMLEPSLQPTNYARGNGQTPYTWAYKRLLFGQGCLFMFMLQLSV